MFSSSSFCSSIARMIFSRRSICTLFALLVSELTFREGFCSLTIILSLFLILIWITSNWWWFHSLLKILHLFFEQNLFERCDSQPFQLSWVGCASICCLVLSIFRFFKSRICKFRSWTCASGFFLFGLRLLPLFLSFIASRNRFRCTAAWNLGARFTTFKPGGLLLFDEGGVLSWDELHGLLERLSFPWEPCWVG